MAPERLARLARAFRELTDVPERELQRLQPFVRDRRVGRGEFLARPGEHRDELALILSGLVRCHGVDAEGREYTKHFFREGDLVAAGISVGGTSQHEFEALEDCDLVVVDLAAGREVLAGHACWARGAARALERVHRVEERRVRALLLDDARARYLQFREDFPGLEARLKQVHVASYIGVTPVSLSRLRARLRRELIPG